MKLYFNRHIDDPLLYHMTWNRDTVSLDEIASSILDLIRSRAEKAERDLMKLMRSKRERSPDLRIKANS